MARLIDLLTRCGGGAVRARLNRRRIREELLLTL